MPTNINSPLLPRQYARRVNNLINAVSTPEIEEFFRTNIGVVVKFLELNEALFRSLLKSVKSRNVNFELIDAADLGNFDIYAQFLKSLPIKEIELLHEKITRNLDLKIEEINAYALTINKTDSTPETNEDAYFIESSSLDSSSFSKTFAISDGATSSPDARTWANMLTNASVLHGSDKNKFPSVVQELRSSWDKEWQKQKQKQITSSTSWWTETALNKPNAATYCSITFTKSRNNPLADFHWQSIAMGDSCLFQIRNNKVILSFPLSSETEFSDRPTLVRSTGDIINLDKISYQNGTTQVNDIFLLATDALAEWIFKYAIKSDKALSLDFYKKITSSNFEDFIKSERHAGRMKDDDSTIINIRVK